MPGTDTGRTIRRYSFTFVQYGVAAFLGMLLAGWVGFGDIMTVFAMVVFAIGTYDLRDRTGRSFPPRYEILAALSGLVMNLGVIAVSGAMHLYSIVYDALSGE